MKKTLAIVQTPFHLLQLERFNKAYKDYDVQVILYSGYLNAEEIKNSFEKAEIIEILDYKFQFKKIRSLDVIKKYRNNVKQIKRYIENVDVFRFNSIVLFTDKDVFNQLFMSKLKSDQEVVAIDEGVGFYRNESYKDLVFKFFYHITSYLLLGMNYQYIGRLGTANRIDRVLVRVPELFVTDKAAEGRYEKFKYVVERVEYNGMTRNVLVLTSPMVEDMHMSDRSYNDILNSLAKFLGEKEFNLFFKMHPRETSRDRFDCKFIDQNIPVEEVDLDKFTYIVNFCSSSVIDIIGRSFPADKIITINIAGFDIGSGLDFFLKTNYYSTLESFLNSADFEKM